jgi:hypothetical protein
MARFTVLGFTEAELGFVLAALFVAVSGYQVVAAAGAGEDSAATAEQAARLQGTLVATRDTLGDVRDSLTQSRAELERLRRLTSRLTPYCSERGETDQPVARIVVVDASTYRMDGAQMPIAGVTARLSRWLETSREKGCRFGIEVVPGAGLGADAFMRAREPLSRLFYFR